MRLNNRILSEIYKAFFLYAMPLYLALNAPWLYLGGVCSPCSLIAFKWPSMRAKKAIAPQE